jgi:hypothetical protein
MKCIGRTVVDSMYTVTDLVSFSLEPSKTLHSSCQTIPIHRQHLQRYPILRNDLEQVKLTFDDPASASFEYVHLVHPYEPSVGVSVE